MAEVVPKKEWEELDESEIQIRQYLIEQLGDKVLEVSETTLVQFVRGYAREKDPKAMSLEKLKMALQWREEYKVKDLIINEIPAFKGLCDVWIAESHGRDNLGHPVYYEKIGKVDPPSLLEKFSIEEVCKAHVYKMERLKLLKDKVSELSGKRLYKTLCILDLDGLGMKHCSTSFYNDIKLMMEIDQYYYPESVYKVFIINAPFVFKMLWNVVRLWIHPLTKEKINILGSDFQEELSKEMDISQLPIFLGGKCKCDSDDCIARKDYALVEEALLKIRENANSK